MKSNLIIGFPGLSYKSEKGRLEKIAGHFPDYDFKKVEYSGITKKQNTITIPFSIETFSKDIEIPKNYDQVGVIASSTGVAVFNHYLSTHRNTSIKWYIAISPFCKLSPIARAQIKQLNQTNLDLILPRNQEQDIKRIIPNEYLQNLLSLDANLETSLPRIPYVLTLIGSQDTIIDIEEAKKHHPQKMGLQTQIRIYNTPHFLNNQSTKDAITFIKKITTP